MSFPNKVIFQQNQSQVGRPPVNNDYISGLHFYGPYPSSSFTDAHPTVPVLSLTQAENAGIVGDYSDETPAVAVYKVTAIGTTSTVIQLFAQEPFNLVQLCNYNQLSTDTSPAILAASISNAINVASASTGYTAVPGTADSGTQGTVTITARPGLGIFSTILSSTITQSGGYTDDIATQFSGGAASLKAVWHYHVAEYFRLMPNGKLFITVTPSAVYSAQTTAFQDLLNAQAFAQGNIRQFGVYLVGTVINHTFETGDITALKNIKNILFNNNQPAEIWTGVDISSGFADISDLPDLSGQNAAGVGVAIGQDGNALGGTLYHAYGKSITTLGATLGATSSAAVNIDIGWVQQYNITDGTELNVPGFANGQLYSEVFNSENNALTQLDNYRYNFIMSYSGLVGTYFNDDKTATSSTDSFANMNDNRVIDKVHRVVYANLLPLVNGPIELNADGTIPPLTLANLDSLARNPMEQMARNGEIAGDASGNIAATAVQIDPTQNVVANNGVTIAVQPTENGTARQILVPIGYAN